MPGRKPRKSSDEQLGTSPLKRDGRARHGGDFQPGNRPANAFREGNKLSQLSHRTAGRTSKIAIADRADAILVAMLEDARCPDHLRSPAFAPSVMAWSRAEAVASLAWDHMQAVMEEAGAAGVFGLAPGVMRAVSEVWKGHEQFAAQLRSKLGIDPVSYAKISRDLGIAANASQDRLEKMAAKGAEVTSRALGLPSPDDGD